MKHFIWMSLIALSCLLTACMTSDPIPEADNLSQIPAKTTFNRPLSDALKIADNYFVALDSTQNTRSLKRIVKNVDVVVSSYSTRNFLDTLFYLVNYENEAGFALLSSDRRLDPVYAISTEGNMSLLDTVYNKGLAHFFNDATSFAEQITLDSGDMDMDTTFVRPPFDNFTRVRQEGPLLPDSVRKFNQIAPFNYYCDTVYNPYNPSQFRKAYVGCVPIAATMIMAYYKWPEQYQNRTLDWNQMRNLGSDPSNLDLFWIMRRVGDPGNLNVSYRYDGSGTTRSAITTGLYNMGYQDGRLRDFSQIAVSNLIGIHHPVYVQGIEGSSGHGWVMDGYYITETLLSDPFMEPAIYSPSDYLFHCTWGWGGRCNGYFRWSTNQAIGNEYPVLPSTGSGIPDIDDYVPYTFSSIQYRTRFLKRTDY